MTSVKGWFEEKIKNGYIRYFEYNEFEEFVEIGRGNFGEVFKANLANTGLLVALKIIISKSPNELDEVNDEIINELNLLREVDYHPKVNRCLGITKDSKNYILVLEYANEGNLRKYLKKNFASLKWQDKIQMALDITSGLKFLHYKGIIHRDLHSKNILVNDRKLLIADLGLSKKLAEVTTHSKGNKYGMDGYIDPQCFKNRKYKKNKKSDIYSLGVLLWEISSGRPPFSDCSRNLITHYINKGDREDPIEGTPLKYQQLYQKCWDDEPKLRPDIEEVHKILCQLSTEDSFDLQSSQPNIDNIDDKSKPKVNDDDDLYISSGLNSRIPFAKFLPIIEEIENIFEEIDKLVEAAAEHNKRTCKILKTRIDAAEPAVRDLKRDIEDRKEFFNSNNYSCLQNLSDTITRIKNFISEISQMKSLIKYFKAKNIEKTFKELCEELDSCINVLSFPIDVKIADELGQLKADQDGLIKYIQEMVADIKLKLNHGLFLDGSIIEPSKQAIFTEDGKLNINLYEGQPLVYTFINDRNSRKNLLSFNTDDNNVELDESLQPSDICIIFPVAEITYTADLSESFSNYIDDDGEKLYEMYGHLFPRKILIGGKLFINGLKSVTSSKVAIFSSYLNWIYNSTKYKKEIPFDNLSALNFFPKILTPNGINLDTHEKLTDWMNNLFHDDIAEIISYNNLVPISQLKSETISLIDEIQPGVANFKEKLTLENWVKNLKYVRWIEELQLLRGLIIDQSSELRISNENAFNLINIPDVNSNDKFYLNIIKPVTILEEILINNNIISTNIDEDISSFPFIKVSDDLSYEDRVHFLVKGEQYNISLNRNNIIPSEKFQQAIEEALESMEPLIHLQEVFDKYGHLIPLNTTLGKSLKNTIENSSYISKRIDLASPVFESLKSHLADFSIPCLLTQKGDIIEENDLIEWIQNTKNDLEIIEFDNIIPLYDILEVEQKKKIDIILNKQNNFRIIMTGSTDLKDSVITKQIIISIEPSLKNKNYEVFGSIISKDNSKLKDIFVTFGSYEIDKFTATIKTTNTNVNIKECYILWMMIGNPSKLSVFSPNNREIQVDYYKKTIALQRNNSSYSIETSHQLSQGYDISIKCFEPINIELAGWSKNCVYFNISNSSIDFNSNQSNVEVAICTLLHSDCENSKIDINGKKYSMGNILTENKYRGEPQLEQTNTRKYKDKRYPIKEDRKKLHELIMTNENLEGHLDLTDFISLEKLQCSKNKLTSLDVSKNEKLTEIDCSQNKLISLDLSYCLNIKYVSANCNQLNELKLHAASNETLEYLNLLDNSFNQNLNCFSHFVNLKELLIGNTDGNRTQKGIYNKFHGSLEPLKNITKLESLSINNTNIDSGLEFLSDSIKNFRCLADIRPEAKVKKIYEQLEIYTLNSIDTFQGRYNLNAWKKNWKLIKQKEALQQVEEELALDAKFTELEEKESSLRTKEEDLVKKNILSEQETTKLKQLINELNSKLELKEVIIQKTKKQLEEKEEKLNSFTAELIMEKEILNKEVNKLLDELEIKEEDMKQSEKQLEETNMEFKAKEDESINLKNELNDIKLSLSVIENKGAELNNLKKKLGQERLLSKTSTSELRKKINDLEKDLKSSQTKKRKFEAKAKGIENELEEIRKHREALQNEQIKQQIHIENLQKDKEILQFKLKIQSQRTELNGLVNKVNERHDLGKRGKLLLDNILEKQGNVILSNDNSASEELEKNRRILIAYHELTEEEIQDILNKKTEITKLDITFKSLIS